MKTVQVPSNLNFPGQKWGKHISQYSTSQIKALLHEETCRRWVYIQVKLILLKGDARCTQHYFWCIQHFKWMDKNALYSCWSVWVIWIKFIHMTHTDHVIQIQVICITHTDQVHPYKPYESTWSVCFNYTYWLHDPYILYRSCNP